MLFLHEMPILLSVIGYIIIIGTAFIRWRHSIKKAGEQHVTENIAKRQEDDDKNDGKEDGIDDV